MNPIVKVAIGIIALCSMLVGAVFAADVDITITIPDAYVLRAKAAYEYDYKLTDGEEMPSAKALCIAHIKQCIKQKITHYELTKAIKTAYANLTDVDITAP